MRSKLQNYWLMVAELENAHHHQNHTQAGSHVLKVTMSVLLQFLNVLR